ncbi:MAG: ATP-binding protein [Verrucomicrobiota bacterium]
MTEAELRELMLKEEGVGVEFKPTALTRKELAEYAVGIGNAGGGLLVMGVTDRLPRQIVPIRTPTAEDLKVMRDSVVDSAELHLRLEVVQTSTGSVLVAHIPARPRGMPLHTRDGKYLIRLGDELRGMTLQEIDAIRTEAGVEFTAARVAGDPQELISAAAMEELRALMTEADAAGELARLSDADLLRGLGLVTTDGVALMACVLLVGRADAIRANASNAQWQFFRMRSDTDYDQTEGGHDCVTVALRRLRDLVNANNPITTVPGWLVHPEFPRYPALALRELLVNAFVHRDYRTAGSVCLKLYPNRLEISSAGGFIGGITPDNILHHQSAARNAALFQVMARIRLANAANLGVPRVFRELLCEGKEPPYYSSSPASVRVTVKGQETKRVFLELLQKNQGLDVDELLVLHYLTRHREITSRRASEICQRPLEAGRELLSELVNQRGLLEAGGAGRGQYYRLARPVYQQLLGALDYYVDGRLALENAKARVLAALAHRPLSNADVREITQLSRSQSLGLMKKLGKEGRVELRGAKKGARWHLRDDK